MTKNESKGFIVCSVPVAIFQFVQVTFVLLTIFWVTFFPKEEGKNQEFSYKRIAEMTQRYAKILPRYVVIV